MPPKSNKRKLDTDDEKQEANKKVQLEAPNSNASASKASESTTSNNNSMVLDNNNSNARKLEEEIDMIVEQPTAAVREEGQPDGDGIVDLRPKYRQAIQDEVHRMKGMDYTTTIVQRDIWLPAEVMINIMLSLSRTTVAIMTRVCKVCLDCMIWLWFVLWLILF